MKRDLLEELKEKYYYDGENLRYKKNIGKNKKDNIAGYIDDNYKYIFIQRKPLPIHQAIWMLKENRYLTVGECVDHIDRNPLNNKIENLRLASTSENNRNVLFNKKNKTGIKGIKYSDNGSKYISMIQYNKKILYLGTYNNILDAWKQYVAYSRFYHKEFSIYVDSNIESLIVFYENMDLNWIDKSLKKAFDSIGIRDMIMNIIEESKGISIVK